MVNSHSEYSAELQAFDTFLGCWNYNTQMHLWRYIFAARFVRDRVVLDIASGVGYGTHHLAMQGAKNVVGVDLSERALLYANASFNLPTIDYVEGNGVLLPFADDSIDIAVSFETIEHVPIGLQEAFVAEIHRVVKPQGMFLCSSLNHQYSPGHADHTREFLPSELFELIRRNFGEVQEYGQFITHQDFAFQQSQTQQFSFKVRRKRKLLRRAIARWFKADPARLPWFNIIRQLIPKNRNENVDRKPVYLTDSLIDSLDPQYEPRLISQNKVDILFDPVAVGIKL